MNKITKYFQVRGGPNPDAASSRHPFEIFLLLMCVVSSVPTLFGAPEPASIEALLPESVVHVWSWTLFLGATTTLVGIAWRDRNMGVLIEQVGLVMVGVAAVIYGVAIYTITGVSGAIGGSIILSFGLSCLYRWLQLQRLVNEKIAAGSSEA